MLGSLIVYLKGMRIMMFQLSGYYCNPRPEAFYLGVAGATCFKCESKPFSVDPQSVGMWGCFVEELVEVAIRGSSCSYGPKLQAIGSQS